MAESFEFGEMRRAMTHKTGTWSQDQETGEWYEEVFVPNDEQVLQALAKKEARLQLKAESFETLGLTQQAKRLAKALSDPFVAISDEKEEGDMVTFTYQRGWWGLEPSTHTVKLAVWKAAQAANRLWRYSWWNS